MSEERETLLMTPGPTEVPADVREAMARPAPNPDVEAAFAGFYRSLSEKLSTVYDTDDEVVVLGGEGMLGLEAAVASLVGAGDRVLCLANGRYGAGFADLAERHGGEATVHEVPEGSPFDPDAVASLLADAEADGAGFDVATAVHCETPAGLRNDLGDVLAVLDDAGVVSVVDAVSSLGGTPVPGERADVVLGASQKCLSAPPGLSTLSVSDRAWERVEATEQDSFYASLAPWRGAADALDPEAGELLPYTHLSANLQALDASLDRLLDEGLAAAFERHERAAERCRERGRELGLETVVPEARCAPTVTAFEVESSARDLRRRVEAEGVVLATGLGDRADDVLRVGHMGTGADAERVDRAMDAVAAAR
jgi:aspartate aminotransferase-like enzyme